MFDRLAGAVCVRVQNQLGSNSAHPALLMFKADTVVCIIILKRVLLS